jgi:RNA polymerase sigma factor (sigma-70 family)
VIVHGKETDAAAQKERAVQEAQVVGGLSARESDVVVARARGLTVKEIAAELGIAQGTVRALLFRAFAKMHRRV